MHRMKRNVILLVIFVMFKSIIWSQDTSNSLVTPLEFSDFVSQAIADEFYRGGDMSQLTFLSGKPWKVWCSHANTLVFRGPSISSGRSQADPLDFGEQVIVTDTKGEWLQIKTATSSGQSIGWVNSAYLLLSPWAMKTSGGAGRKALVVPNLDLQSSAEEQLTRTQLYDHPNVSSQDAQKGRRAGLFRILYVYKETDSAMLLGVTPTIKDGSAGSVILGWMPKKYLTEWNRRVAYGPATIESTDAPLGEEIPFFMNESELRDYEVSCRSSNSGVKLSVLDRETIPHTPAFPDIGEGMRREVENKRRELLAIVGSSTSASSNVSLIETRQKLDDLREQMKKVNLLFIVDATASMGRYFGEISKSIQDINDWSLDYGGEVQMQVGFGIYRDYPDCPDECWDNLGEIRTYDGDMGAAIQKIECKSKGTNRPEAVYKGILENLRDWSPHPNETNIVILIGDEGNHAVDANYSSAQVRKELQRINASLFAFQATAYLTESSMKFQSDVLNWMDGLKKQNDNAGNPTSLKRFAPGIIGFEFENENTYDSRRAKFITQSTHGGAKTNPESFSQAFETDVEEWFVQTQKQIDKLQNILDGTGIPMDSLGRENAIQTLMKGGLTRETSITFLDRGGDLAMRRYTSIENCDEETVLLPYVFITRSEYNQISQAFGMLKTAGTRVQKANALYDMCLHLIKVQVGDPIQVEKYLQKTMGEIWIEFFQVDFNISSLRDVKVSQVRGMQDDDFEDAYEKVLSAYYTWDDLPISDREWRIARSPNERFYWVEARFFPGFEN